MLTSTAVLGFLYRKQVSTSVILRSAKHASHHVECNVIHRKSEWRERSDIPQLVSMATAENTVLTETLPGLYCGQLTYNEYWRLFEFTQEGLWSKCKWCCQSSFCSGFSISAHLRASHRQLIITVMVGNVLHVKKKAQVIWCSFFSWCVLSCSGGL